ncbi:MAG: hypothetical protein ACU837_13955 [Gammaproteobacteria bacterium]
MIRPFRNFLIILVALLQLVAPLVHAHASARQNAVLGIHLPGLEFISTNDDIPMLHAEVSRADCCGILIDVGCGLQQSKFSPDLPLLYPPDASVAAFNAHYIVATINFSPHSSHLFDRIATQPIAPRAPPSLFYSL